ncbi:MAG: hypothetical protein ACOC6C_02595 [Verrucomicrobiota bacterium]
MKFSGFRIICVAAIAAFVCGCTMPSDRDLYIKARNAVEKSGDFPGQAEVEPIGGADIYRGKNAACVVVPYEVDIGGRVRSGAYRVWLKRVAMTWKVDRLARANEYNGSPAQPAK